MRNAEAGAVEAGKQKTGVGITKKALGVRGRGKIARRGFGDAVRPITAAREPQGVDRRIRHRFAQGSKPLAVRPREMSVAGEALLINGQLDIPARGDDRLDRRGGIPVKRATRCDDGDLHGSHDLHKPRPPHRAAAMTDLPDAPAPTHYHFCGIGGSGMLPLAAIVRATGACVTGSDRSLDAGRLASKFDYLRGLGIALFAQDGSGVHSGATLVTSAAIEPTVPDVVRARDLGLAHLTRPQLLAQLLNAARTSVAVGGTSGKSTVTGMIGWMLHAMDRQPTVMNGAVMRNFVSPNSPFASALVGDPELFVSEVDESDGSIALYRPGVAVLGNVSLDHKSMDELRSLFGGFLAAASTAVINLDDPEARQLADRVPEARVVGFGFDAPGAALAARNLQLAPDGVRFDLETANEKHAVELAVPGRHNAQNALAALGAIHALGLPLGEAVAALARFAGLKRRLETVGTAGGVTVIDDFGHNPDKIAATLATLTASPGRLLIMFQPHGFGPLAKMGGELAHTFAQGMRPADRLFLPDPVYQGGTVDASRGSDWLAGEIRAGGGHAEHFADRAAIAAALLAEALPGDRIAILGARDDTLGEFALDLVGRLGSGTRRRAVD